MVPQAPNSMMYTSSDKNAPVVRLLLHVIDLSGNQDVILAIKKPRYDLDSMFAHFSHFCISPILV